MVDIPVPFGARPSMAGAAASKMSAERVEPQSRLVFQCVWVDAYEPTQYTAVLDPGMLVIAAPRTRMSIDLTSEGAADTSLAQVIGVTVGSAFAQAGGSVVSHPRPTILQVPESGGTFPLTLSYRTGLSSAVDSATLILVVPKSVRIARGRINGYVMGAYPSPVDDQKVPDRFVEITPDLMDLHLSKHFHMRDFVSSSRTADQAAYFPKYAIIRYALIVKVEKLVNSIDHYRNFECKGIRVFSGYRTPDFNRVLPEAVERSYHQYGLAADLIIDSAPADGQFDDINQDGKTDIYDVVTLARFCDHLEKMGAVPFGGIGIYQYRHSLRGGKWSATYHVHVDVRKSSNHGRRWGYAFRDGRRFARIEWK